MQLLCYGQSDSAADAAADDADVLETLKMGGNAEGTDEVLNVLTYLLVVELFGSCADNLENDPYGACLAVIVSDGKGDTLAVSINAQDDELTGLGLGRNEGSFNVHHRYGGVEFFLCYDFVHFCFAIPFKKIA